MENFVIAALFTWESSTYLSEDVQWVTLAVSVTRFDNLLHFGQLFKACGDNYFAQVESQFWAIFVTMSKSLIF